MPDQTTDPKDAPKDDAPKDDAKDPKDAPKDSTPDADAVEFDGPYDEERAKRKIAALLADRKRDRERLAEVEAAEQAKREAEMTEAQKAAEQAKKAEERAEKAERALLVSTIARENDLPEDLLTATDEAGLKAQAAALVKFRGEKPKDDRKPPGTKPRTQLKPATGDEGSSPANDPKAIAERLRNRRR